MRIADDLVLTPRRRAAATCCGARLVIGDRLRPMRAVVEAIGCSAIVRHATSLARVCGGRAVWS